MLKSDRSLRFDALAGELSGLIDEALDTHGSAEFRNERLGQLIASLGRLYAQKAQDGEDVRPFGMNSRPTVTDVAILCTAMMDAVGLELFELGGWQTMSGLGSLTNTRGGASEQG